MNETDEEIPNIDKPQLCFPCMDRDLAKADVFFSDEDVVKYIDNYYVLCVDIMGVGTLMLRSFRQSAIIMGKFHAALVEELNKGGKDIFAVPVIDGTYVLAKQLDDILDLTRRFFWRIGEVLIHQNDKNKQFLIRGGLSFGPICKGLDLTQKSNSALANDKDYRQHLVFGAPLSCAHNCEGKAPAFGIYIDDSVRFVGDGSNPLCPLSGFWFKWCNGCPAFRDAMSAKIAEYFQFAREHSFELLYDDKKIDEHEKAAGQYWDFDWKGKK